MLALAAVSVAVFGLGVALGVVAIIAQASLREDRQRSLHLTIWQLLSLKIDQRMEHHRVPEHQAKEESSN
jgi:hypothetical protein